MSEQFYLTLSSDSPCGFNNTNKTSSFKVHLGRVLHLPGQWEVCLFEIWYPTTLFNVRQDACEVVKEKTSFNEETGERGFTGDMGFSVVNLAPGYYHNNADLINEINHKLNPDVQCQIDADKHIKFTTNAYNNAYEYLETFRLNPSMRDILGLPKSDLDYIIQGDMKMDLRKGLPSTLSVTTNIITEQIVNNSHTKILRSFQVNPNKYEYGFQRKVEFNKLVFLPVSVKEIECVEINIIDDTGSLASFTQGHLKVILQLRKVGYE
jgi:hypothetical protein